MQFIQAIITQPRNTKLAFGLVLVLFLGISVAVMAQTDYLSVEESIMPAQAVVGEPVTVSLKLKSTDFCTFTAAIPLDVALVIDISGTMDGQPLNDALDAASVFVNDLQPRGVDQVAVITFNNTATEHQSLSADLGRVLQTISTIQDTGGTTEIKAGLDAGRLALGGPQRRLDAQSVIILLSDGDTKDVGATSDAAVNAKTAGIDIVSICLGGSAEHCNFMKEIATSDLAPYYYNSPSSSDLASIYRTLAEQLTNTQAVTHVRVEHKYANDKVELESISDSGQETSDGKIIWEFPTLTGEHTLSYQARVIAPGQYDVGTQTDVTYVQCEQGTPQPAIVTGNTGVDIATPTPTSTPTGTPTPMATPTPTPTATPTPTPTPASFITIFTPGGLGFLGLPWWWWIPLLLLLLLLLLFLLRPKPQPVTAVRPPSRIGTGTVEKPKKKPSQKVGGKNIETHRPTPPPKRKR
jgi:Mg-chelatase subunit ChlD